jgi:hypothetical protein
MRFADENDSAVEHSAGKLRLTARKRTNRADVPLLTLEQAMTQMDFEVIYARMDWKDPSIQKRRQAAKKYEVLVPMDIPLHLIRGA